MSGTFARFIYVHEAANLTRISKGMQQAADSSDACTSVSSFERRPHLRHVFLNVGKVSPSTMYILLFIDIGMCLDVLVVVGVFVYISGVVV